MATASTLTTQALPGTSNDTNSLPTSALIAPLDDLGTDSELSDLDEITDLPVSAPNGAPATDATIKRSSHAILSDVDEDEGNNSEASTKSNKRLYEPDSDSDSDIVPSKRVRLAKSSRTHSLHSSHTRSQTSKSPLVSSSSDDDYAEPAQGRSGNRTHTGRHLIKPAKKPMLADILASEMGLGFRAETRRRNDTPNYNEDDDGDLDDEEPEQMVEVDNRPVIDQVLDWRYKEDIASSGPTAESYAIEVALNDIELKIKWEGLSHQHASWEDIAELESKISKGFKKALNFKKKVVDVDHMYQHDKSVSPEDAEKWHLDREAVKALQETHTIVERVISVNQDEAGSNEYLVKWRGLDYSHCTWEFGSLVEKAAQPQIDAYSQYQAADYSTKPDTALSKLRPREDDFNEQPAFVVGGQLKEFQLTGLQFLVTSWYNRKNVILADEMGLGKTVQTVTFLNYLLHKLGQGGPFLVVVPLSTVPAWCETFDNWASDINYIVYHGTVAAKQIIQEHELWAGKSRRTKFHVMITTNEQIRLDYDLLSQIKWASLVVDEAHVLKNDTTQLYQQLAGLRIPSKFFLTGTPIQNDLKQLWNLLNFLNPGEVHFDPNMDWESEAGKLELRNAISPFILQRQKIDVQKDLPLKIEHHLKVPLSPVQLEQYKSIFMKDYEALNKGSTKGNKQSLLNVWAELKKISNHPFLIENAKDAAFERFPQNQLGERAHYHETMVRSSNKMMILDRLLGKLKADGRRVLIFSQMVQMLNLLDDYMTAKGYQFQRLDGNIAAAKRQASINHFQEEGSSDFCFLLSTRAGGVGINLMAADAVVLFDSDYNPQVDLQAIGRAHRIGQKREVDIYRLISEYTVDDTIVDRAAIKLRLAAISSDLGDKEISNDVGENDCQRMIKDTAKDLFQQDPFDNQRRLDEVDILHEIRNSEKKNTEAAGLEGLDGGALLEKLAKQRIDLDNMTYEDILPAATVAQIKTDEEAKKSEKLAQELSSGRPTRKSRQTRVRPAPKASTEEELDEELGPASEDEGVEADNPDKPLSESEIRRLYRAYERFGSFEDRGDEILHDARLVGRSSTIIKAFIKDIYQQSEKAVAKQEARWSVLEERENRSLTKKEKGGAVQFKYENIDMNAQKILRRPHEMQMLRQRLQTEPDPLKVVSPQKAPDFTCSWGEREDAMLLLGIEKHGYGAWVNIRDDPELGMQDKMFLEEHRVANKTEKKKAQKPTAAHLIRRTDSLLLVIEDSLRSKNTTIEKAFSSKTSKINGQAKKANGAAGGEAVSKKGSTDRPKDLTVPAGSQAHDSTVDAITVNATSDGSHSGDRKRKSHSHNEEEGGKTKRPKLSPSSEKEAHPSKTASASAAQGKSQTHDKTGTKSVKGTLPASDRALSSADPSAKPSSESQVNGITAPPANQPSGNPKPSAKARKTFREWDDTMALLCERKGSLSKMKQMQSDLRDHGKLIASEVDVEHMPKSVFEMIIELGKWIKEEKKTFPGQESWERRLWSFVLYFWEGGKKLEYSDMMNIHSEVKRRNRIAVAAKEAERRAREQEKIRVLQRRHEAEMERKETERRAKEREHIRAEQRRKAEIEMKESMQREQEKARSRPSNDRSSRRTRSRSPGRRADTDPYGRREPYSHGPSRADDRQHHDTYQGNGFHNNAQTRRGDDNRERPRGSESHRHHGGDSYYGHRSENGGDRYNERHHDGTGRRRSDEGRRYSGDGGRASDYHDHHDRRDRRDQHDMEHESSYHQKIRGRY